MSTLVAPPIARAVVAPRSPAARAWLFSPGWDLLFLANLSWPLIAAAAFWGGLNATWENSSLVQSLVFWQVYFISTPHRWITLGLVFLDEDRFRQRPATFVGLGLFFILFVTAVVLGTGTTLLLVAIDFFWNAWHFAAQHSGISRIYNKSAHPQDRGRGWIDKVLLRTFILFVILRVGALACVANCGSQAMSKEPVLAKHTAQLLPSVANETLVAATAAFVNHSEAWLDFVLLAFPLLLVARDVCRFRPPSIGGLAYLVSVVTAYTTLLFAARSHQTVFLLAVALAIALFHATEYLAIVSWAVIRKHSRGRKGILGQLVPRWGLALATFILVLALSAWMLTKNYHNQWAVVTIAVSFLHYAYDGIIWKAPRKPLPVLT